MPDGRWKSICTFLESLVGEGVPVRIADLEVIVAALTRDSSSFCRFCTSPLPESIGFDINDDKFADVGQDVLDLSLSFRKLRYELVRPRRLTDNDFFSRFFHGLQEQLQQMAIDQAAETSLNSADSIGSNPENPADFVDEIEYTLLSIPRASAFNISGGSSASEHRASDWKESVWQGRCRVVGKGKILTINLVDARSDEIFARCVVPNGDHEKYIQATSDSTSYFVLKIPNGPLHYFLGFGFEDRADAFSFSSCLLDFKAGLGTSSDVHLPAIPAHDFSMKEGETITVNLKGKSAQRDRKTHGVDDTDVGSRLSLAPPPAPDSSIVAKPLADNIDFGGFQSADSISALKSGEEKTGSNEALSRVDAHNSQATDLQNDDKRVPAGDANIEIEQDVDDKAKTHEPQLTSIPLEDVSFHNADRKTFSLQTGCTFSQSIIWPRDAKSDNFHWKVLVLDELTVELEIRALLRPCDITDAASDVILQKTARGGTFVGKFRPARDKRLIRAKQVTDEDGSIIASSSDGHLEVETIVFNFSNKFSWFSSKEVEIVTVFESRHTAPVTV